MYSEASPAPVCQACREKSYGRPFSGSAKAGRGHGRVVTFGGVTEIEHPVEAVMSSEGEETKLLRRLLSKATVAMPTIGLGSQLSEREGSQVDGADTSQTAPPWTPEATPTPAEIDARLAQYVQRTEEEEEEDEERIPDLQKDDMMARRTGVFHKQNTATVTYNRFLPLPASQRGDVVTDAPPCYKKEVQADKSKKVDIRRDQQQQPRFSMETPQQQQQQLQTTVIRGTTHSDPDYSENEDEYGENEPVPDLEKDDMMARRARLSQKASAPRANQFLPVPGSVKYSISPVSPMKPLHNRPKLAEKMSNESSHVKVTAEPPSLPPKAPLSPTRGEPRAKQEEVKEEEREKPVMRIPDATEPLPSSSLNPPPCSPSASFCTVGADVKDQRKEEKDEVKERKKDVNENAGKRPVWLEHDELPPMMMSRRVAFLSEDTESVSMSDILNEDEVGHLPPLSQSRYERMHEQYNSFKEEEDHWQDDLARWKNRRRSASQELIKKEEERKRIEKRMKEEEKRKSIKTYKEIVEEKERREAELCEAYRNAATPEEAALVLQRYALRFTISDATLDSLKLPRSTSKPKQDLSPVVQEHKVTSPVINCETADLHHTSESAVSPDQEGAKPEKMDTTDNKEISHVNSFIPPTPNSPISAVTNSQNVPPQSLQLSEPQTQQTDFPSTHQKELITDDAQLQTKHTQAETRTTPTPPAHTLPSPSSVTSRPVPLLAAKPYCQPKSTAASHKPIKMDGLVRVNGETTEELPVSTPPTSLSQSLQDTKEVSSKQTEDERPPEAVAESPAGTAEERPPPPQMEKPAPSSGSTISSLLGGRNCITTTTIVTELTQTHVEPLHLDVQSNGQIGAGFLFGKSTEEKTAQPAASPVSSQDYSPTVTEGLEESSVTIETPMLNLAKRVNHWVWDPNEERKRLERWQQEQERRLQEQYEKEQEKLKKEWEKAQLEVEEEERKHNEEERRILEETVTPLNPTGLLNQQPVTTSPPPENNTTAGKTVPPLSNGQKISTSGEDQHASKLHFFQDSACDGEPSKKQELWKTASLDRNTQQNQGPNVKRSGSHDIVTNKQQSSPSTPQPPSPSRCVSGKRLCSGCSQPLGKGAAMIIDTLGLFFHIQCFKCGVCHGQLGDATAGTDVRIRNGLLSCHECYIASRGRGQPTTL
ncbi:LIM and calponin homology domains-containing protein 1-like isoform X2 [Salarias fasciatus]|uniref:LIM and calponin homology domains-containing protein 1-like isoform X2 n=1 Tax=Salarias fasciatus TaxID=181472 RepID=UPI0011769966|nr:LIM and calponin homology domains-containing protein 1-like isoform X2 [Salarias fasciatus]